MSRQRIDEGGGSVKRAAKPVRATKPAGSGSGGGGPFRPIPANKLREAMPARPVSAIPPAKPATPVKVPANRWPASDVGAQGTYVGGEITATPTGEYAGAPSAPPMFDPSTWDPNSDSTYLDEAKFINQDTDSLLAQLASQRSNYDIDFGKAIRNLGWRGPEGASGLDDILSKGAWDTEDTLGAYGQAMTNQENDYAGRGMMNSSFYAKALSDLGASFDQQRGNLVDSRSQFSNDLGQQEAAAKTKRDQALAQARASAAARAAAMYGLV